MTALTNQVAFVTGGGRAIGREIALRLARDGADVALFAPEKSDVEATAAEIRKLSRRALECVGDVTDESQVADAVARTARELGPIDILINNAGIMGPTAHVADIETADWQRVIDVNLTGAFLCCKLVTPEMKQRRRGTIVNISSMAGKIAFPLRSPYAVSKWGLVGLTKTLAAELGPFDVRVNAICPGPVEGERMRRVIEGRARELGQTVEEVRAYYVGQTVLGRMVDPQDVAAMAAFLASDAAVNVTGQAIDVSAGYAI